LKPLWLLLSFFSQGEKYQKSASKKLIIVFLVVVVVAMIIGVIFVKRIKK
jgi:hypothetical protein